jgi:hypothetical protein
VRTRMILVAFLFLFLFLFLFMSSPIATLVPSVVDDLRQGRSTGLESRDAIP